LTDLLSYPLHRIPEYTELIGKLSAIGLANSLLIDEDNFPLSASMTTTTLNELHIQLKGIAKSVQESISDVENAEKMFGIQQIIGEKLYYDPSRKFIREGVLGYLLEDKGRRSTFHEAYVFVLNDQMLLVNKFDHHKLLKQFLFEQLQITDSEQNPVDVGEGNVFSLVTLRGEESCKFSLKTMEEKKSWVADITKAINKYRVFRVPLEELLEREKTTVPMLVRECIDFLDSEVHLKTEGIFRTNPNLTQLKELLVPLNQGKKPDFSPLGVAGVNMAAEILKRFFREMIDPLLTAEKFPQWMIVSGIDEDEEKIAAIRAILQSLPKSRVDVFRFLLLFLQKVAQLSKFNKMNSSNLAIMFSPLMLFPRNASFNEYAFRAPNVASKAQGLVAFMIDNSQKVSLPFPEKTPSLQEIPSPKALTISLGNFSSKLKSTTMKMVEINL